MSNKNTVNYELLESLSAVVSFVLTAIIYLRGCGQLVDFLNVEYGFPLIISWGFSLFVGLLFLGIPLGVFYYCLGAIFMVVFYPFFWFVSRIRVENK